MMNKFKMVLGCVALSLLPGGILAVVLSGPNDALFYGYFVVALPFLIMLYMGVGSLLLGILIFGIKLMGWSSRAFLIVGMFIAVIAIYALRVMVVDDLPLALPIAASLFSAFALYGRVDRMSSVDQAGETQWVSIRDCLMSLIRRD